MRRGNPLIRMIMPVAINKKCVYPTSLFLLRNEEIATEICGAPFISNLAEKAAYFPTMTYTCRFLLRNSKIGPEKLWRPRTWEDVPQNAQSVRHCHA